MRLLLVGYLYGITSERRLMDAVRVHLAYRWFTRLGFDQEIPEHSTFSKNRNYLVDTTSRVILSVQATPALFSQEPWLQGVCLSMLVSSEFTHRIWQPIKPMEVESFLFLAWLLARNIQPHIPVIDRQHQTRGRFTRDAFRCEPQENAYYCPEGKPLHHRGQRRSSGGYLYRSTEAQCRDCPQKKLCTAGPYRKLFVHWQEPAR